MPIDKTFLEQAIKDREIQFLTHFTHIENVERILKIGLYSRDYVDEHFANARCLDSVRADNMTNGICLSISFPNDRMFYSYRMRSNDSAWAVLLLSPKVLTELDCAFFPTNAANSKFRGIPIDNFKTNTAFNELFNESIESKNMTTNREAYLLDCDPTDVQAEVIVFEHIPVEYILGCVFDNKVNKEIAEKHFSNDIKFFFRKHNESIFTKREWYRN